MVTRVLTNLALQPVVSGLSGELTEQRLGIRDGVSKVGIDDAATRGALTLRLVETMEHTANPQDGALAVQLADDAVDPAAGPQPPEYPPIVDVRATKYCRNSFVKGP